MKFLLLAQTTQIPMPEFPAWAKWIMAWFQAQPVLETLLLLIALDVLTGVIVSVGNKTLDSSISWRGMSRKALTVITVGVSAVLEPWAHGIPLMNLTASFYAVSEAISIVENAAAAGVPMPQALIDALAKLRGDKAVRNQAIAIPPPAVNINLVTPAPVPAPAPGAMTAAQVKDELG